MTTVQEVSGGAGRGSFNSLPVEFGLAKAMSVQTIEIRWPNGFVQTISDVGVDQVMTIIEADLTGGPVVDVLDLLLLLDQWGDSDALADLNGDGVVDVLDLLILLNHWS